MERDWIWPTALLCFGGFFFFLKPSEPFFTAYLLGPVHNLTEEQVVSEVFPVWIYTYLASLLPIFLLTDYLKYKPIILFQALGHICCWLLLLFGRGVPLMQLVEVFYALGTAGEIGFNSYIYSVVDKSHYQRVTSFVRVIPLVGYLVGSVLGQLLVSIAQVPYFYLNVITLVDVSIAFVIFWFLPMPKITLFSFTSSTNPEPQVKDGEDESSKPTEGAAFNSSTSKKDNILLLLWRDAKQCYLDTTLLRWSIWWALSTCGWLLVANYVQNLWETIRPSSENDVYNGAVYSLATVLGALGAYGVGYLTVDWGKWGELSLGVFSLVKCGLLMAMYWTTNIWICYAAYVIFACLYNVVITITQFQLAVGLTTRRFALVFGLNTFAAVALNTILTIILIDQAGLALDIVTQFIVYSGYFGIVALVFLLHAFYSWHVRCRHPDEDPKDVAFITAL